MHKPSLPRLQLMLTVSPTWSRREPRGCFYRLLYLFISLGSPLSDDNLGRCSRSRVVAHGLFCPPSRWWRVGGNRIIGGCSWANIFFGFLAFFSFFSFVFVTLYVFVYFSFQGQHRKTALLARCWTPNIVYKFYIMSILLFCI